MSLFKKEKYIFDKNISPACEYCEYGSKSRDNAMILCKKKGIVSPFYSCNKFVYNPIQRTPKRRPDMPKFSKEDFKL